MKKQTKKKQNLIALMPADPELAKLEDQSEVLSTMAIVPDLAKKIEAVGEGYAKLQGKFFRNQQRNDIKAGNSAQNMIEDSESSASSDEDDMEELKEGDTNVKDTENKRKKKTKEQIEKEALEMGDLYGLL